MYRHVVAMLLIALLVPLAHGAKKTTRSNRSTLPVHTEMIEGYGRTAEKARALCLERAQERVRELLEERFSTLNWQPEGHLLEPAYLAHYNVLEWLGPATAVQGVNQEPMFLARYQLTLTPEYLSQVRQEARLEVVEQRHHLLARILAGLVAFFLVLAGYLRLEEMTRGFATGLLRLSGAVILLLVSVVLWWTWTW